MQQRLWATMGILAATCAAAHADTIGNGLVFAPPPGVFAPPPKAARFTFTFCARHGSQSTTTGALDPGQSVAFGFADPAGNVAGTTSVRFYLEFTATNDPNKRGSQVIADGLCRSAGGPLQPCQIEAEALTGSDLFGLSGTTGKFVSVAVYPPGTFPAVITPPVGGGPAPFPPGWIYQTYGWAQGPLVITVP